MLRSVLLRAVTPLLLLILAVLERHYGGDAMPTWMANAMVKTGGTVPGGMRALIGLQLTGAVLALLFARMAGPVAWITYGALAFVGLADLSAVFSLPGQGPIPVHTWVVPLALLLTGVGGLWILTATPVRPAAAHPPLTVWRVLLGVLAAGIALAVAGRVEISPRTLEGGVPTVIMDPEGWVGQSVRNCELGQHEPRLIPLTLEETKWIVFYHPSCGRCHDVFDTYFSGDQEFMVIAVEVPPARGTLQLRGDDRGDIHCLNCTRLALPSHTNWLGVTTPTIVKVENGVVTCVTSSDYSRCRQAPGTTE